PTGTARSSSRPSGPSAPVAGPPRRPSRPSWPAPGWTTKGAASPPARCCTSSSGTRWRSRPTCRPPARGRSRTRSCRSPTSTSAWRSSWTGCVSGSERALRHLQLVPGELLDVDVLEGDDPYLPGEAGGAADVPPPRVLHRHLEVDLGTLAADAHVHAVGEVEPTLGLHDVAEEVHDVAVLAVERQLHLGLVLLQVLRAHRVLPSAVAAATSLSSGLRPSSTLATGSPTPGRDQDRRWCSQSPCSARASRWAAAE